MVDDSDSAAGKSSDIVVPGECLGKGQRSGWGTYQHDGEVLSQHLGLRSERSGFINVSPLKGRYQARTGDHVIGIVQDVGPSSWFVDINAAYPSPLHANDTPWRVEYGDAASHLTLGDAVLLKVKGVVETRFVQVTMRDQGLRKLTDGHILDIPISTVPRLIGKGGSMINSIKESTGCNIYTGQNGRVWLDGDDDMMLLAMQVIEMIIDEAHRPGLTERVRSFLDDAVGRDAAIERTDHNAEVDPGGKEH